MNSFGVSDNTGISVPADVGRWLQSKIVGATTSFAEGTNPSRQLVQLDPRTSKWLENGFVFGKLVESLSIGTTINVTKDLTMSGMEQNWRLLRDPIEQLGIDFDEETINFILMGDTTSLSDLLVKLHKFDTNLGGGEDQYDKSQQQIKQINLNSPLKKSLRGPSKFVQHDAVQRPVPSPYLPSPTFTLDSITSLTSPNFHASHNQHTPLSASGSFQLESFNTPSASEAFSPTGFKSPTHNHNRPASEKVDVKALFKKKGYRQKHSHQVKHGRKKTSLHKINERKGKGRGSTNGISNENLKEDKQQKSISFAPDTILVHKEKEAIPATKGKTGGTNKRTLKTTTIGSKKNHRRMTKQPQSEASQIHAVTKLIGVGFTNIQNEARLQKLLPILPKGSEAEKTALVIASANYDMEYQSLKTARTAIEFACMCLCRSLSVKGNDGAALLSSESILFVSMVTEGPFRGAVNWLKCMLRHLRVLEKIILIEQKNKGTGASSIMALFDILRPALLSDSTEVCQLALAVMNQITDDLYAVRLAKDVSTELEGFNKKEKEVKRAKSKGRSGKWTMLLSKQKMKTSKKKRKDNKEGMMLQAQRMLASAAWDWLKSDMAKGDQSIILACYECHPYFSKQLWMFCEKSSRGHYRTFILDMIQAITKDPVKIITLYTELIPVFAKEKWQKKMLTSKMDEQNSSIFQNNAAGGSSSIFSELLNIGCKNASRERSSTAPSDTLAIETQNARHVALEMLTVLWLNFQSQLAEEENFETAKEVLLCFRRSTRSNHLSLIILGLSGQLAIFESLITALSSNDFEEDEELVDLTPPSPSKKEETLVSPLKKGGFSLKSLVKKAVKVKKFTSRKEQLQVLASYVYKMVVIAMIESQGAPMIRDFLCENLARVVDNHKELPISVLVEPLVRQLNIRGFQSKEETTLLPAFCRHPKLGKRDTVLLLDLLGKQTTQSSHLASITGDMFASLVNRFKKDMAVVIIAKKFCKISLSMFMKLEVNRMKDFALASNKDHRARIGNRNVSEHYGKQLIIIRSLVKLCKISVLRESLLELVEAAQRQYMKMHDAGKPHKGLDKLLHIMGYTGDLNAEFGTQQQRNESPQLKASADDRKFAPDEDIFGVRAPSPQYLINFTKSPQAIFKQAQAQELRSQKNKSFREENDLIKKTDLSKEIWQAPAPEYAKANIEKVRKKREDLIQKKLRDAALKKEREARVYKKVRQQYKRYEQKLNLQRKRNAEENRAIREEIFNYNNTKGDRDASKIIGMDEDADAISNEQKLDQLKNAEYYLESLLFVQQSRAKEAFLEKNDTDEWPWPDSTHEDVESLLSAFRKPIRTIFSIYTSREAENTFEDNRKSSFTLNNREWMLILKDYDIMPPLSKILAVKIFQEAVNQCRSMSALGKVRELTFRGFLIALLLLSKKAVVFFANKNTNGQKSKVSRELLQSSPLFAFSSMLYFMKRTSMRKKLTYDKHWFAAKDFIEMKFRLDSQIRTKRGDAMVPAILRDVITESQSVALGIVDDIIFNVTRQGLLDDPSKDVTCVSMRRIFEALDYDHDEKLSKMEVLKNIQNPKVVRTILNTNIPGVTDKLLNRSTWLEAFQQMDYDKDGMITWKEFQTFCEMRSATMGDIFSLKICARRIFNMLDHTGDGIIEQREILQSLQDPNVTSTISQCPIVKLRDLLQPACWKQMFRTLDANNDGVLTRFEFAEYCAANFGIDKKKEKKTAAMMRPEVVLYDEHGRPHRAMKNDPKEIAVMKRTASLCSSKIRREKHNATDKKNGKLIRAFGRYYSADSPSLTMSKSEPILKKSKAKDVWFFGKECVSSFPSSQRPAAILCFSILNTIIQRRVFKEKSPTKKTKRQGISQRTPGSNKRKEAWQKKVALTPVPSSAIRDTTEALMEQIESDSKAQRKRKYLQKQREMFEKRSTRDHSKADKEKKKEQLDEEAKKKKVMERYKLQKRRQKLKMNLRGYSAKKEEEEKKKKEEVAEAKKKARKDLEKKLKEVRERNKKREEAKKKRMDAAYKKFNKDKLKREEEMKAMVEMKKKRKLKPGEGFEAFYERIQDDMKNISDIGKSKLDTVEEKKQRKRKELEKRKKEEIRRLSIQRKNKEKLIKKGKADADEWLKTSPSKRAELYRKEQALWESKKLALGLKLSPPKKSKLKATKAKELKEEGKTLKEEKETNETNERNEMKVPAEEAKTTKEDKKQNKNTEPIEEEDKQKSEDNNESVIIRDVLNDLINQLIV
eukprot:g2441.t1